MKVVKVNNSVVLKSAFKPVAVLLEWSLPGPLRGSEIEMFSWLVLTHFSLDREDRSHSHRPSSKSQRLNPSGDTQRINLQIQGVRFHQICRLDLNYKKKDSDSLLLGFFLRDTPSTTGNNKHYKITSEDVVVPQFGLNVLTYMLKDTNLVHWLTFILVLH